MEGVGGEDGEGEEVLVLVLVLVCGVKCMLLGLEVFLRGRSELPLWCAVWETSWVDVAPFAGAEWRKVMSVARRRCRISPTLECIEQRLTPRADVLSCDALPRRYEFVCSRARG